MRKNSLTKPTWNTLKIRLFRTHTQEARTRSACSNFKNAYDPECISKAKFSNFKLLVTLSNNTEAGKKSVLLIHPIGYDRSGQNKLMRDEELISRKAEHLSTVRRHILIM